MPGRCKSRFLSQAFGQLETDLRWGGFVYFSKTIARFKSAAEVMAVDSQVKLKPKECENCSTAGAWFLFKDIGLSTGFHCASCPIAVVSLPIQRSA